MTQIVTTDGRVIFRDGKASAGGAGCCCEPPCGVIAAQSGGAGTTVNTYEFPSAEHCIWVVFEAYSVPDRIIVRIGGDTVWDTGSVSGQHTRCVTKPQGETSVEVTVEGPDGTAWDYTLVCDGCPEPEAKYCCRDSFECNPNNPALQGGTVAFCRYVEPPSGPCSSAQCAGGVECDGTEPTPSGGAPWDCRNGLVSGGAFVQVSGFATYRGDTSGVSACLLEIFSLVDSLMNDSWFVPLPCFGVANNYEIKGNATVCDTPVTTTVFISLNLCNRSVSVTATIDYVVGESVGFSDAPLEKVQMSCNNFSACFCTNYGGEIVPASDGFPATTINVFAA